MKIVITTNLLKGLVGLSTEALRGQIDILEELGFSTTRRPFIERLRSQAEYLLKLVETIEDYHLSCVQNTMDEIANTTAMMRNLAAKMSVETCDPEWKQMAEHTTKTHNETVKSLGGIETAITKDIGAEIASTKEKIANLLKQIENLRIC